VERLARKYLRRPVVITIGSAGKAVDRITQRVTVVKDNEKPPLLEREITCVLASYFSRGLLPHSNDGELTTWVCWNHEAQ